MMNIVSTLNEKLLNQPFSNDMEEFELLVKYQQIAYGYTVVENSIAVLSDLKSNKSYVYNGKMAERLGLAKSDTNLSLNSIWEEDILERIEPDDLIKKHSLELQFFHYLKALPLEDRSDYYITSKMRMKDSKDEYTWVQHRMFYVCNSSGSFWLALCLYNLSRNDGEDKVSSGVIVNSATGGVISSDSKRYNNILTKREKEILSLIDKGKMSKDIANMLSISIYTINRHRQNILEKLRVKNSHEACRVAKLLGLF
jgi:DNA-binding CsgD family transcriptional regulator